VGSNCKAIALTATGGMGFANLDPMPERGKTGIRSHEQPIRNRFHKMKLSEDQLCLAFAEQVKNSAEFAKWVLNRTKFKQYQESARLLHEEQMQIRPRKFWRRHWWCHVPELAKDRETDIFMVFEVVKTKYRFALHIENKKSLGRFLEGQAEAYEARALHMMKRPEYLNYEEFETVLISPRSFRARYGTECDLFDSYISYEDVAKYIPEFGC
jgi:hypothetical protein